LPSCHWMGIGHETSYNQDTHNRLSNDCIIVVGDRSHRAVTCSRHTYCGDWYDRRYRQIGHGCSREKEMRNTEIKEPMRRAAAAA
jgi:hypothetical protein